MALVQQVIAYLSGHQVVLALAIKSILDMAILLSPGIKANSVIEWLYLKAAAIVGSAPQA